MIILMECRLTLIPYRLESWRRVYFERGQDRTSDVRGHGARRLAPPPLLRWRRASDWPPEAPGRGRIGIDRGEDSTWTVGQVRPCSATDSIVIRNLPSAKDGVDLAPRRRVGSVPEQRRGADGVIKALTLEGRA